MTTKDNKLYISIFVYIIFALVYWQMRKMIKSNYGETGNIILIVLLVALSYIFWNTYYRVF